MYIESGDLENSSYARDPLGVLYTLKENYFRRCEGKRNLYQIALGLPVKPDMPPHANVSVHVTYVKLKKNVT